MKLSSLAALGLILVAAPAAAQDEGAPAVVVPASHAATPEPKVPGVSIALERVGGVAYAKASDSEGDNSLSVTGFGVGGVTPNPFAIPRVGVDFILPSNLTLGGAVGFSHVSASVSDKSSSGTTRTEDVGSVFPTRSRRASATASPSAIASTSRLAPASRSQEPRSPRATARTPRASSRPPSAPMRRSPSVSPTRSTCSRALPSTTRSRPRSRPTPPPPRWWVGPTARPRRPAARRRQKR